MDEDAVGADESAEAAQAQAFIVNPLTGRKMQYHSVPYRSITHFSVETAGTFDLDAELTIWISGGQGIVKQFGRGVDVYEVQALLASFVAR